MVDNFINSYCLIVAARYYRNYLFLKYGGISETMKNIPNDKTIYSLVEEWNMENFPIVIVNRIKMTKPGYVRFNAWQSVFHQKGSTPPLSSAK